MKNAILKAIEGGYGYNCGKGLFTKGDGVECYYSGVNSDYTVWVRKDNDSSICIPHEDTLLDPLFWQSLGRALGWEMTSHDERAGAIKGKDVLHDPKIHCSSCHFGAGENCRAWQYHWHRFIDHLIAGKDAEEFFTNLLK